MKNVSKILVPFDFSETSKNALQYAIDYVGKDEKLKILLAYISNEDNYDVLEEAFSSIKSKYGKNLKHEMQWVSFSGTLSNALLYIQKEEHVKLIIMGTDGDHGDHESNTSHLVLKADCPVLVVPSSYSEFRMKNLALVIGSKKIEDNKTLATLLDIARRFGAKVKVITIKNHDREYGYSEIDEQNESKIQYYLENFYADHTFIENPDIVKGILDFAKQKEIDAIAILPRNHSVTEKPSKGQLTEVLVLQSQIPILAID
ncbi:MAG: universal stress protein [Bacteroidota bacterium]